MKSPQRKSSRSKSSDPSSPELARLYALRLLADRDYTSAGLREKLRARGFAVIDLESAISRLENEGWISDRRFAERFAESALASGRFHGARLRQELRRRGLDEKLVSEVIAAAEQGYDENEELRALLSRRFPGFSSASADDREKRRLLGFLQRRGFSFSAIMAALRPGSHED